MADFYLEPRCTVYVTIYTLETLTAGWAMQLRFLKVETLLNNTFKGEGNTEFEVLLCYLE